MIKMINANKQPIDTMIQLSEISQKRKKSPESPNPLKNTNKRHKKANTLPIQTPPQKNNPIYPYLIQRLANDP